MLDIESRKDKSVHINDSAKAHTGHINDSTKVHTVHRDNIIVVSGLTKMPHVDASAVPYEYPLHSNKVNINTQPIQSSYEGEAVVRNITNTSNINGYNKGTTERMQTTVKQSSPLLWKLTQGKG